MLFNVHCHVLPHMDDGASSTEEAVSMLKSWKMQGVDALVATPHFYGSRDTMDGFLYRRQKCYDDLMKQYDPKHMPEVFLGAEIRYFKGLMNSKELPLLALGKSNYFLIEPPMEPFSKSMIEELRLFVMESQCSLIIAHVDRYLAMNHLDTILELCDGERICGQISGEALLRPFHRKKSLFLLEQGYCCYLGDDAHNMTTRKPLLADAVKVLEKKIGHVAYYSIEKKQKELYNYIVGISQ